MLIPGLYLPLSFGLSTASVFSKNTGLLAQPLIEFSFPWRPTYPAALQSPQGDASPGAATPPAPTPPTKPPAIVSTAAIVSTQTLAPSSPVATTADRDRLLVAPAVVCVNAPTQQPVQAAHIMRFAKVNTVGPQWLCILGVSKAEAACRQRR